MADAEAFTWVLVCGGFRRDGGMDRANLALARYLVDAGARVHVISHDIDRGLAQSGLEVTIVGRPFASAFAGELALDRAAQRLARRLRATGRAVRLVGNGGSCTRADVSWIHSVHHAWPCRDAGAPLWFKAKNRGVKRWARIRERRAVMAARAVVANSHRTARELTTCLEVSPSKVHVVYLGSDAAWQPAGPAEKRQARVRWARDPSVPLLIFAGALGYDTNKGIDRLLAAWRRLRARGWSAELVVAGAGHGVWRNRAADLHSSVRFVGHVREIGDLMDAADLLLSPVSYEAYGLAAHEALCRGVPVMMTRTAGIAERLPDSYAGLLLAEDATPEAIADRIAEWQTTRDVWRARTAEISAALRCDREVDMAARLVQVAAAAAP